MTASRVSSVLAGVSGEYFVAGELSRRGYVASITLRNTRGIDILASNADATRSVSIQVKASQVARAEWMLSKKSEEAPDEEEAANLFYVFVSLNGMGAPSYYVVPRAIVAAYTRTSHANWLATPGKKGQAHRDNPVRKFADAIGEYRDAWHLLRLDTGVPVRPAAE